MRKLLLFLALSLPCALWADNASDTVVIYNGKKIVVSNDSVNTKIAVYNKDGSELKKASETTYVDGQEVEQVYVSSPFLPKKKNTRAFVGYFPGVYMGTNVLSSQSFGFSGRDDMYTNDSRSCEFGFSTFNFGFPFNSAGTFGIVSALQLGFVKCSFDKNYKYDNVDGKNVVIPIESDEKLKESYLKYAYVRVPVMLEWQRRLGKQDFYIGAGMSVIIRDGWHSRYKTDKGRHSVTKDLNINSVGLGADAHVGYMGITLYIHSDITPLFNTDRAPKCYPVSVGIGFGL